MKIIMNYENNSMSFFRSFPGDFLNFLFSRSKSNSRNSGHPVNKRVSNLDCNLVFTQDPLISHLLII